MDQVLDNFDTKYFVPSLKKEPNKIFSRVKNYT